MNNPDYIWSVVKPISGHPGHIMEMNAKLAIYDPSIFKEIRDNLDLVKNCHDIVSRDVSIAELFRNTISKGY